MEDLTMRIMGGGEGTEAHIVGGDWNNMGFV